MTAQPYCRYCGSPIAKRTRQVYFVDEILPHMKPDGWTRYVVGRPSTKAEAQALVNEQIVALRRGRLSKTAEGFSEVRADLIHYASTWDGESYRDEFFCTDRHAVWFSYAALKSNPALGLPAYHDSVARAAKKGRAA